MDSLADALAVCAALLADEVRHEGAQLFVAEHLDRIATRLLDWHTAGPPAVLPPPHLAGECTPPLASVWNHFQEAVAAWAAGGPDSAGLAAAWTATGTAGMLLVLGQRVTPGSVTDHRAIPPPRADLLAAAAAPHGGPLSAAARALDKHAGRPGGEFWGTIAGGPAERNRRAAEVVGRVLAGATWWNVFAHPLHGLVYEVRLPSGHGARWGVPGPAFVGFVGPFRGTPDG